MKMALYGATGMVGQRILREALQRGHDVTAIARDTSGVTAQNSTLQTVSGDILDAQSVAQVVAGQDVVITAYGPGSGDPQTLVTAARSLIAGLKQAGVKRLVIVGGAGTLEVAPGVQLLDTDKLPKEWMPLVLAHRDAFNVFKAEGGELDYSYFSPAALIEPGERTRQIPHWGRPTAHGRTGQQPHIGGRLRRRARGRSRKPAAHPPALHSRLLNSRLAANTREYTRIRIWRYGLQSCSSCKNPVNLVYSALYSRVFACIRG